MSRMSWSVPPFFGRTRLGKLYFSAKRRIEGLEQRLFPPSPEPVQPFHYAKPGDDLKRNKEIVVLTRTRTSRTAVHVIRKGGEENLHSHSAVDGLWFVLKGRVRFHGEGDEVFGEFGPMAGILVPRNNRYWFESIGDGDTEILQVLSFDRGQGFVRTDHAPRNYGPDGIQLIYDDPKSAARGAPGSAKPSRSRSPRSRGNDRA